MDCRFGGSGRRLCSDGLALDRPWAGSGHRCTHWWRARRLLRLLGRGGRLLGPSRSGLRGLVGTMCHHGYAKPRSVDCQAPCVNVQGDGWLNRSGGCCGRTACVFVRLVVLWGRSVATGTSGPSQRSCQREFGSRRDEEAQGVVTWVALTFCGRNCCALSPVCLAWTRTAGRLHRHRRLQRPPHSAPPPGSFWPPATGLPANPTPRRTQPARRAGPHRRHEIRPYTRRRRPQSPRPRGWPGNQDRRDGTGFVYLHTALDDDHPRLAYTQGQDGSPNGHSFHSRGRRVRTAPSPEGGAPVRVRGGLRGRPTGVVR